VIAMNEVEKCPLCGGMGCYDCYVFDEATGFYRYDYALKKKKEIEKDQKK